MWTSPGCLTRLSRREVGTPESRGTDRPPGDILGASTGRRNRVDPAGAAADFRRALALFDALPSRTDEAWFLYACSHAALSGLRGPARSGVSAHEASSAAEAAMALLHKTVDLGYGNAAVYRNEDALDPLRDRAFRLLLMHLAMPSDPFAPAR
jgi:hypothetical protein